MDEISKKPYPNGIGALKRLGSFASLDVAETIYNSLIQPQFDYCCSVWDDKNNQLAEKLQKLQNRAARVITKSSYEVSSSPLLAALGREKLISNRRKHEAIMVFKFLHNLTPMYLHNILSEYLKRSFSCSGAALWNSLPQDLSQCNSQIRIFFFGLPHGNHINQLIFFS